MNHKAFDWAWSVKCARSCDKFLLICLATRAIDDATSFPNHAVMIADTNLDRKTIIAGLQRLESSGLIVDTEERTGQTRQTVVYRLTMGDAP